MFYLHRSIIVSSASIKKIFWTICTLEHILFISRAIDVERKARVNSINFKQRVFHVNKGKLLSRISGIRLKKNKFISAQRSLRLEKASVFSRMIILIPENFRSCGIFGKMSIHLQFFSWFSLEAVWTREVTCFTFCFVTKKTKF